MANCIRKQKKKNKNELNVDEEEKATNGSDDVLQLASVRHIQVLQICHEIDGCTVFD